jgi:hypothetical protein
MGNLCAKADLQDGTIHCSASPLYEKQQAVHPNVMARLVSAQATSSKKPKPKPPLVPPLGSLLSSQQEGVQSPETPVDLQCPRSHAGGRRRVPPQKQSPRVCPSAFHSVMTTTPPPQFGGPSDVFISGLQLLGSRRPPKKPLCLKDDDAPDGGEHKALGAAEIDGEAGEERAGNPLSKDCVPPLPLMTPFQRRRMEVKQQRRSTGEGDCCTNASVEPSLTNDSCSTATMLGDEFSNDLDAFA